MVESTLTFSISRCYGLNDSEVASLQQLYDQLSESGRQVRSSEEISRDFKSDPDDHQLFVARLNDDRQLIIGMVTLIIYPTISCYVGRIEDMVVDKNYRGQGVAKQLMDHALGVAKSRQVERVDLTSRSERQAANNLYKSLGMHQVDTNVYRLSF